MPHSRATDQGSSQPTGGSFLLYSEGSQFLETRNQCLAQEVGSPYPFKPISPQTHLTENAAERYFTKAFIDSGSMPPTHKPVLQEDSMPARSLRIKNNGIACGDRVRSTLCRWRSLMEASRSRSSIQFHRHRLAGPQRAIMVGGLLDRVTGLSRGMVLWTQDAGLSWQKPWIPNYPCYGA